MTTNEIRAKYLAFMEKKGHAVIPSSPLLPENDPTTLFTGSGMQPLIPYLMGEDHPKGVRLADSQKCFRSGDIEEVGDNRHTTFFEMLGNWSLGDYFKEEQIRNFWEFLTKELSLDPSRLYVTCYIGNPDAQIPKDTESAAVWTELFSDAGLHTKQIEIGSEENGYAVGDQGGRIFFYSDKNWWSRAGGPSKMPVGEPGGPDTEVFYVFPEIEHDTKWGALCHPNCDCGRYIELGNSVFMQYVKTETGFDTLPKRNVDYGGGLERIAAAVNSSSDVFPTNHRPIIEYIETSSGKKYGETDLYTKSFRIIADHMKAAVFLIADGIEPSNTDQGYFVRRLVRRSVRHADLLGVAPNTFAEVVQPIANMYKDVYPNLLEKALRVSSSIALEEAQFRKTLEQGLKQFNKISLKISLTTRPTADEEYDTPIVIKGETRYIPKKSTVAGERTISGANAFELFTTYGFPIELTEEIALERGLTVDVITFRKLMDEHRELSRKGAEQKFKGGLADNSDKVVMYHTATHLLLAGLRKELGEGVHQAGSNITGERLRFDFTYGEKVGEETLKKVEQYVNDAIHAHAQVKIETISKDAAQSDPTIEGSFWERYPDEVKVYSIVGDSGVVYSRELCGGPHVESTGTITGTFKIIKEESSSQGVRRVKAVLE
jgi:alanyl-tRNA synthetase